MNENISENPEKSPKKPRRGRPKKPRNPDGSIFRPEKEPTKVRPEARIGTGQRVEPPIREWQTVGNAARLFGTTIQQMKRRAAKGMPSNDPGDSRVAWEVHMPGAIKWEVEEQTRLVIENYEARIDEARGTGNEVPLTREEEELRLLKANADVREHQRRVMERETVEIEAVEMASKAIEIVFRAEIEGRAGRRANELANETNPAAIRQMLLQDDKEALTACADRLNSLLESFAEDDVYG